MQDTRTREEVFPTLDRLFKETEARRRRFVEGTEEMILLQARHITRRRKREAREQRLTTIITVIVFPFWLIASLCKKLVDS